MTNLSMKNSTPLHNKTQVHANELSISQMMTCAKFESHVNLAMQAIIQGLSIVWWCVFWKSLVMRSLVYMDSVALVSAWGALMTFWRVECLFLHVQYNVDVFCWVLLNQQSCLACLSAFWCMFNVTLMSFVEFCWISSHVWRVCTLVGACSM